MNLPILEEMDDSYDFEYENDDSPKKPSDTCKSNKTQSTECTDFNFSQVASSLLPKAKNTL